MKRLNFMFMAIAIIFFSCSKETTLTPDEQAASSLKSHEISFEGISTPTPNVIYPGDVYPLANGKLLILGNTAEWYESSDEPLVTGQSIWYVNWLIAADWSGAEVWGTTDLYVGLESGGDPADAEGKWEMIWHGWLTDAVPDGFGFFTEGIIEVDVVGTGVSGVVEGMTAHWIYTLDISTGIIQYDFVGTINSKPVTKTMKIQRAWGGFELINEDPYFQTRIVGEGEATHIGHFSVLNTYDSDAYMNPVGGPWLGFITAANGDEIHTQMVGVLEGEVYHYIIIGGTGRFMGATGELFMSGEIYPDLTWYLEGEGTITY